MEVLHAPDRGRAASLAPTRARVTIRNPLVGVVAAALLATTLTAPPASAQGLSAVYEYRDGEVYDIAAQSDASTFPDEKRMWVAQGRVRAAVRLSDGARMRSEDRSFLTTPSGPRERPICVEIDEGGNLLYTLTAEGRLYRETIVTPSTPILLGNVLDLATAAPLASHETLVDMKLWSATGEKVVVILTNHRVITVADTWGQLFVRGYSDFVADGTPLTDTNPSSAQSINSLVVTQLDGLSVGKDGDNRVVAYVKAFMQGYEDPLVKVRPYPRCIVLCDLDLAGGFLTPRFKKTAPGGTTYHVFHNPMPCAPVGLPAPSWPSCAPGTSKYDYSVNDTTFDGSGPVKYLYAACGRRNQVRKLDVTHAFTAGITQVATIAVNPAYPTHPQDSPDLSHVRVDPNNTNRIIAFEKYGWVRVVDTVTGAISTIPNNNYSSAGLRDVAIVKTALKPTTVWTMDNGLCDFVFKVVDASTANLTLDRTDFWTFRSDGAVALEPDAIYMLSIGGVVRCVRSGGSGDWLPDPATYQPARTPSATIPGAYDQSITEHIDIGRSVLIANDDRLFTANGKGGFNEFLISPTTRNPMPATLVPNPDYASLTNLFPGWLATDPFYANDVAFTKIGGVPFVFTDVMNQRSQTAYLLAWGYDLSTSKWRLLDAKHWATGAGPGTINTDTIHLAMDLVKPFAFVSTTVGFFSVGLSTLPVTGQMFDGGAAGLPLGTSNCKGVASSGTRVFAFYRYSPVPSTPSNGRLVAFDFDPSTGVIATATPVQTIDGGTLAMPAGHTFQRAFRARYHRPNPLSRCGALYACGDGGTLIEFSYDPRLTLNPLAYKASWKSDYDLPIQDCHLYDFGAGPKLLTVKDSEGFALVTPSVFNCP